MGKFEWNRDMTELRMKIEEKREQMINNGLKFGLSHEDTIANSKELDNLLTIYQKLNN